MDILDGEIGLTVSCCFRMKELGGGTVLDIGIYCAQLTSFVFCGEKPQKVISAGTLNDEGVDVSTSSTLVYSNGKTATLITHAKVKLPNEAHIIGTKGTIKVKLPSLLISIF